MTTKRLARELGLLRQRSQSSAGSKKVVSNQIFSHLIVIDFESTCWREKNNYSQEIIEFPAILLNTSTGEIESEFHTYVQPQEHPVLSRFCTELTGITQMQVEAGIPLQICLSRFSRWLQNLQLEMGIAFPNRQQRCSEPLPSQKLCTFLTWSDWDLGVCLQYECKRKQLHKPDALNSWIDLRSTYRLFYDRKPKGLNGALQDLGIQFSGREHSGLDDSRNTAKLAARMMRDGCVMKITRSLDRTPSTVKPMFGSTTADQEKSLGPDKKENTLNNSKPLSSTSCQISLCSEKNIKNLVTKENPNSAEESVQSVQSLIAPKTLLNSTGLPLLGHNSSKLVKREAVTNLSKSIMINCSSPHSNDGSSLVMCATTVGCLSNLPQLNQLSETGAPVGFMEEEEGGEFLVETEERCGSYDDVVLEGDDVTDLIDSEHTSAFDSVCEKSHSAGDVLMLMENANSKTISKTEMMNKKLSTTSVPSNIRSHVVISNQSHKTSLGSVVSGPNSYFAVPKSVTLGFKKNLQKTIPQLYPASKGVHKTSNTTLPLKSFAPEKTSTPNASFARPKPIISQLIKHKQTPKSSFTIYTDPARQATAPSNSSTPFSVYTSKNILSSLSTNTLSTSTSRLSVPLKIKDGGKITSPLCACGRRAKRQVVSNGGPNQGRGFYCCSVRRSGSGSRIKKGCEFFKWESAVMRSSTVASPAVRSSVSLCQLNSTRICCPQQNLTLRKSY